MFPSHWVRIGYSHLVASLVCKTCFRPIVKASAVVFLQSMGGEGVLFETECDLPQVWGQEGTPAVVYTGIAAHLR